MRRRYEKLKRERYWAASVLQKRKYFYFLRMSDQRFSTPRELQPYLRQNRRAF